MPGASFIIKPSFGVAHENFVQSSTELNGRRAPHEIARSYSRYFSSFYRVV